MTLNLMVLTRSALVTSNPVISLGYGVTTGTSGPLHNWNLHILHLFLFILTVKQILYCTVLIFYIYMFHSIIIDVFNHCSTIQYCVFLLFNIVFFVIYISLLSELMTSEQYCTELHWVNVRYIVIYKVSNTVDCY